MCVTAMAKWCLQCLYHHPLTRFATSERHITGSCAEHSGSAAPGLEYRGLMQAIEEIVAKLPAGVGIEWTGMSYQERVVYHRLRCCMPSRCWSYSSVCICMRCAGRCPSLSFWWYHWVFWER